MKVLSQGESRPGKERKGKGLKSRKGKDSKKKKSPEAKKSELKIRSQRSGPRRKKEG